MQDRHALFGAVLGTIQAELDWERLGRAYCDGDGTDFFDAKLREQWLDVGLQIADGIARELLGASGRSLYELRSASGRSLYIGAALAEVPTMLVETIVLGRDIVWINLRGDEIDELTRVMRLASAKFGVALPLPSFDALDTLPRASFDHVWMVSVLTDPDHFPALHDELYERRGTDLATGRGSLADDRARAESLAGRVLDTASPNALITTSDEELEVLRPLTRARRIDLRPIDGGRLSALVGDNVRSCRLVSLDAEK